LDIEGHWITRDYKNNLKMMFNTQNASLGMENHDISIDLSLGSTCERQDGNNVIVFNLSTTLLTTKIMSEPTRIYV
jgi:hypothetical protein